jgi:SNF2 family DNA or RNA helicase
MLAPGKKDQWGKEWLRLITNPGTWQVVIADEVHRSKNRQTDQSSNLYELAKPAPYAVGLSATPTDGKAHEWFGVLRYIDPWRFTAYHRFFDMFTDWFPSWDGRYKEIRRDNGHNGAKNTDILDDVVADYAIRRLPGVESGIPPIRRKRIIVEMESGQRAAYEEMLRLYKLTLQSGAELHAPNTLSQATRLRQILVHPALVGAGGTSAKINATLEILEDLDTTHNVVIYCTLVNSIGSTDGALLRLLERRIKAELHGQWDVRLLWSQTPEEERHDIENWLREGKGRVVVLSAQTGGTSLNLQGADIGIFLDRPWSSTLNHQCEGRLPRPGSDAPYVLLIDIVCANSLDEHVLALLDDKQGFNEHRFNELMARYILNGGE